MEIKFRTTFDLMDYTAQQFDLLPEQRKELYKILEEKNILKESKSPGKEAAKLAKQLIKRTAAKAKEAKSLKSGKLSSLRNTRRSGDIDDLEEESDLYEGDLAYEPVPDEGEDSEGASTYDADY
ncbi:MAG: hypothetical protein ABIC40_01325 [bacterium]